MRFGVPFADVPLGMDYGEAWRLLMILLADPSSQVSAALGGWDFPVSRDGLVLRDLYDLQHAAKSKKKPEPYPRPWPAEFKRLGAGTSMTIAEFQAMRTAAANN